MKWINSFILILFLSTNVMAQEVLGNGGGDDAGNGGFAYKQSIKILKLAAQQLESKILSVDMPEFKDHPEWRTLLSNVLKYDNLEKTWWHSKIRNGQPLSMDYNVRKPKVIVLKHYYQSFMGKTDNEIEESVIETQKRLVHEASHIWGYNESDSEEFSERFLIYANNETVRTTGDITINPNFCSCLKGRSDIINNCTQFCSEQKVTLTPMLYLEAILGKETLKNPKIKSLHDWCNRQLEGDSTTPQCTLTAFDGINKIENIPVSIISNSNKLTADVSLLKLNTTYLIKIVESKTGSVAESVEFQMRRVRYSAPDEQLKTIGIMPVNQFTCLTYFGNQSSDGTMNRLGFKKDYFYYPQIQSPAPIPSTGSFQNFVCHDEMTYGKNDSAMYPRLETIGNKITLFDYADPAFLKEKNNYKINSVIQNRLADEYNVSMSVNLINSLHLKNSSPESRSSISGGYFVVPFINGSTNLSFCPSINDYYGVDPIFSVMKDYFSEMEGLYVAESEPVTVETNENYKTFYPNQFVRESDVLNNGFTLRNGLKEKVTSASIHRNTVYFYYPFSESLDIMIQGNRKLFTIKPIDQINEPSLRRLVQYHTSDNRIGCIPKSQAKPDERGSRSEGEICNSDYQCLSLCCDNSIGACKAHDITKGLFCAKSPGQFCIDQSFCLKENVPVCKLYKSGLNADGSPKCVVRCPSVTKFGECKNNYCLPPQAETNTNGFDLTTCKGAIDP